MFSGRRGHPCCRSWYLVSRRPWLYVSVSLREVICGDLLEFLGGYLASKSS